jgi:predicted dehydrogenase
MIVKRAYLPGFAPRGSEESRTDFSRFDFGGCDNAKVVALAGKNIEQARELARRYDIPNVYEDWRELIDCKDVEAVCVATPNYLHAGISVAAANAGRHVMVEKPMAVDLREADAMIDAAARNGVLLMVKLSYRFLPAVEVASRLVRSGILGRIVGIRGRSLTSGPESWAPGSSWFFSSKEAGYGSLLDVGIHTVDLVRYLSAQNVKEVAALGGTLVKGIPLDDNAMCLLRFEDGSLGAVEASWTAVSDTTVAVSGDRGLLEIRLNDKKPLLLKSASSMEENGRNLEIAGVQGVVEGDSFLPLVPRETEHRGPFQYFIDCILKSEKPFVSGEEGRASLEVVLAAYISMREGRFVALPLTV